MTDRFNIVSIGIENEGAVIVGVIMRAKPGSAVVDAAGQNGGSMEFVDKFPALGCKGDMRARLQNIALTDPEESPPPDAGTSGSFRDAAICLL